MKRVLIVTLLLIFPYTAALAQKIKIKCPTKAELDAKGIEACPLTGCGPAVDPHLNEQKNVGSSNARPKDMTIEDLQALLDPVKGFKAGNTREKLKALGEGDMIRVEAYALRAR